MVPVPGYKFWLGNCAAALVKGPPSSTIAVAPGIWKLPKSTSGTMNRHQGKTSLKAKLPASSVFVLL